MDKNIKLQKNYFKRKQSQTKHDNKLKLAKRSNIKKVKHWSNTLVSGILTINFHGVSLITCGMPLNLLNHSFARFFSLELRASCSLGLYGCICILTCIVFVNPLGCLFRQILTYRPYWIWRHPPNICPTTWRLCTCVCMFRRK